MAGKFQYAWPPHSVAASSSDYATATNAAATITYSAAGAGIAHVIGGLVVSYKGGTPSGSVKIEDGSGTTIFFADVKGEDTWVITFPQPKRGSANTDLIVTLADGGASAVGKVNVTGHWTE